MNELASVRPPDPEYRQPSRGRTALAIVRNVVLQLLIFFVFYTLSIGPMFWKWYAGWNVEHASPVAAFYEPLHRLAAWSDSFGHFMNWYVDLWIG